MAQGTHEWYRYLQRRTCPSGRKPTHPSMICALTRVLCRTTALKRTRSPSWDLMPSGSAPSSPGGRKRSDRARPIGKVGPSRSRVKRPVLTQHSVYHGERARFHYFQCLQVLLRIQAAALIRVWELPPEFEVRDRPRPYDSCGLNALQLICRDVWALNLALLPTPPIPEPLLHALDGSEEDHASKASLSPRSSPEADEGNEGEDIADGSDADQSSSSSGSSSGSEPDDEELEELMRENSETPSDDDAEPTSTPKPRPSARTPRKRRTFGRYDTPASTISCLVVACWTLRLPVMYVDFVRYATTMRNSSGLILIPAEDL